jgi:hypothetical protein
MPRTNLRLKSLRGPGATGVPIYEINIAKLNTYLAQAVAHCLYRLNRLCWTACACRPYCLPEAHGLKDVDNLDLAVSK